jgi:predicted HAD superfamily Cof-like phosphohydrolase
MMTTEEHNDKPTGSNDGRSQAVTNYFKKVIEMHEHFGIPMQTSPGFLDPETMQFRIRFLDEELGEIDLANENHDLEEIADGLIDLIIVALGTAAMMGLPLDDMFQEVHEANMRKVRVEHAGESKRGHGFDLKKPVDWKGPNLRKFL